MEDSPHNTNISSIRLSRRRFAQGAGLGLVAALPAVRISASDRKRAWMLWQQENAEIIPSAITDYVPVVLTNTEWATLTAVVDRLFPSTDTTPGGAETGAHIFIDRALNTVYTANVQDYRIGLAGIESASIDGNFSEIDPAARDAVLSDLEAGKIRGVPASFFSTLLGHTQQGMFCDPIHGGNREFLGWDMIGYPGMKLVWTEADQAINAKVAPQHISVQKYGGQPL